MSVRENVDNRARLLSYARWTAIGLACLAALILAVFSGSGALRFAAFLAVVAVVLVVLSITMNGSGATKVHLEEMLLEEIDMLREDVRADITTAARATHRVLSERVNHLNDNVEGVRRQLAERALGAAAVAPAAQPIVAPPPQRRAIGGPGVVHHTETVHVTTHYMDPADDPRAGYAARPPARRPEEYYEADSGHMDQGGHPYGPGGQWAGDRPDGQWPVAHPDAQWPEPEHQRPEARHHGLERIRPREPVDDRPGWDRHAGEQPGPGRADRYDPRDQGRGEAWGHHDAPPARPARAEEQWPDPRAYAARADRDFASASQQAWGGMREDDTGDDWGVRSGDRWAEVRTDERGRELRMGERRTAVRTDETGTHMRIVDRWETVREQTYENTGETRRERREREEAGGGTAASGYPHDDRGGHRVVPSDAERWGGVSGERDRPALPASGPEPAAGWILRRDSRDAEHREPQRAGRDAAGDGRRPTSGAPVAREFRETQRRGPWDDAREAREPAGRNTPGRDARDRESRDRDGRDRAGHDDWQAFGRADRDAHSRPELPSGESRSSRRAEDHGDRWSRAEERDRGRDDRARDDRDDRGRPRPSRRDEARPHDDRPRADHARDDRVRDDRVRDDRVRDDRVRDDRVRDDRAWEDRGREDRIRDGRIRDDRGRDEPGGRAERGRDDRGGRRDDNRWEREPSGGRSAGRPAGLDFDVSDDRW